jgi:hypothetical protein
VSFGNEIMAIRSSIFVQCPICSKVRKVDLPKNIFEYECAGLLYLKIQQHKVCEHSFFAILDRCLSVRDYANFEEIPKSVKEMITLLN